MKGRSSKVLPRRVERAAGAQRKPSASKTRQRLLEVGVGTPISQAMAAAAKHHKSAKREQDRG